MSLPDNATALVTGGARRIGAHIVESLCRAGWTVWFTYYQSRQDAEALCHRLHLNGGACHAVYADLSQPNAVERVITAMGSIPHLAIHSASFWGTDTWSSANGDDWERSRRLHVWPFLALARQLDTASTPGEPRHLIAVTDARIGDRDFIHFSYSQAKQELGRLARTLAFELAPRVRVNAVAPGLILAPTTPPPQSWIDAGKISTPLQTTGALEDLLRGLHYLIDSPFVTGQVLWIDGGRHLRRNTNEND